MSNYTKTIFSLSVVFVSVATVFAWSGPSSTPPSNNTSAPLNVSGVAQSKAGGLLLNTGGAANALIIPSGNVGIGATNPTNLLHLKSSGPWIKFEDTDGGSTWLVGAYGGNYFDINEVVGFNGYSRLTIKEGGNVGIGTVNPSSKLAVAGVIESTSGGFKFPDGTVQISAGGSGLWSSSGANNIYNANSGNVGIGTNDPAAKLHVKGNVLANNVFVTPSGVVGLDSTNLGIYSVNSTGNLTINLDSDKNGNGSDSLIVVNNRDGKVIFSAAGGGTTISSDNTNINGKLNINGGVTINGGLKYKSVIRKSIKGVAVWAWCNVFDSGKKYYLISGGCQHVGGTSGELSSSYPIQSPPGKSPPESAYDEKGEDYGWFCGWGGGADGYAIALCGELP